jgi:hypothetical protein
MTTPRESFEPIRGFVESEDGQELTEIDLGVSYTVDGGTLGLIGLLSPEQQQWVLDCLRESGELPDVRGGDSDPNCIVEE